LDWSTGEIMNKLEELEIAENTLLIFTSDNGAPMGEDLSGTERGTNRPLYGRGYTTSEGGFRVPTLMWWPGTIPAGTVNKELVTTMDLLPTFAHLAGGKLPDDRIIDGHNIWPLLKDTTNTQSPYEVFYYYHQEQLQAIRRGPWKLFVPLEEFSQHPHFDQGGGQEPLLFNVVEDRSSSHNVAKENPEVVEELMEWAQKGREELGDRNRPGKNQRAPGKIENPVPVSMK
ncbi:sulfatase-like hydrolase/transferase, partial [Fodinibius sp.]|uniref:sulfatase-like hydrolase/transferase n=1 Tax=Fodinibius sp. TaxID=1872440 RepID=UPI003566961A